MIPSSISPDTKSNAEKRVFSWFENSKGTEDWVVLHSLGIAEHKTRLQGEVDFLVLVPRRGVFALEVKGGRVKRDDSGWSFTDRYNNVHTKARGPFEQASEAMHSIRDSLKERVDSKHRHIEKTFFSYGVMFPDIEYNESGIDEVQWRIFDCRDGNNVRDYIMRLSNAARESWEEKYGRVYPDMLPSKGDVNYLAGILRGNFDKAVSMVAKINTTEEELIQLTQQQYRVLDQIEDNPRSVIHGSAGTGKTLLAFEQVKREALKGKKIALFCFNNSLGEWFKEYFRLSHEEERPAFVGTFHQFLLGIAKKTGEAFSIPNDPEQYKEFFNNELPRTVIDYIIDHGFEEFDEIVIDEAQDLIRPLYIDVFDLILKRGFDRGKWSIFGDFSKQAIYSEELDSDSMLNLIEERTAFVRLKLITNCRNTKEICEEIQTITGYDAPKEILNIKESIPVEYITYKTAEDAVERLEHILSDLREQGIKNDQITILSTKRRENSLLRLMDSRRIKDFSVGITNSVTFSTIHSFKGLENTVIILIDIEAYSPNQLMYVALSRARTKLYVLNSNNARKQYTDLLKERIMSERQS